MKKYAAVFVVLASALIILLIIAETSAKPTQNHPDQMTYTQDYIMKQLANLKGAGKTISSNGNRIYGLKLDENHAPLVLFLAGLALIGLAQYRQRY